MTPFFPALPSTQGGHERMKELSRTWRPHATPAWLRKIARVPRYRTGIPGPYGTGVGMLWDHWGTVRVNGESWLITSPYDDMHPKVVAQAQAFSKWSGTGLLIQRPGIWFIGTTTYVFVPGLVDPSEEEVSRGRELLGQPNTRRTSRRAP